MSTMQPLDIIRFPLSGRGLIEASAGTGKTYTIAGLYLRLLLEKQLEVTQILVVTFTEAATQELRGRIRQRILDATLWLDGRNKDDELAQLLEPYRDNQAVIQRLRDAMTRMDEASIYTIHGFCQRSLSDSAFESGMLFDNELVTDETALREQAIFDFWRKSVVAASRIDTLWVLEHWKTPSELLKSIDRLIKYPQAIVKPDVRDIDLSQLEQQRVLAFNAFKSAWNTDSESAIQALKEPGLLSRNAKTYKPENLDALSQNIQQYCDEAEPSATLPHHFELLTQSKISDPTLHLKAGIKKGLTPPERPLFTLADDLYAISRTIDAAKKPQFMLQAAEFVVASLQQQKQSRQILFFDDLLTRLDAALSGEGGEQLAQKLRQRYRVAMIDEFQDTDDKQYRIFNRIYANQADTALLMIGDPKQAIYSFRGADIFTYMQARQDTDPVTEHYTLGTNYRSSHALIECVNAIFEQAEKPFIYDNEIPFQAVQSTAKAKAQKHPLTIEGEADFAMLCWTMSREKLGEKKIIAKGKAKPLAAAATATEIARLLNLGQLHQARIGARALAAQDIAVLVRDRFEAEEIRRALREVGVASVTISRDSVFDSEEAQELLYLLRAIADPGRITLVRTALATRIFGFTAADIDTLNNSEKSWEQMVEQFLAYQAVWLRQGFLLMFHRLMREMNVTSRLLSSPDGERRMTNLLQLLELAHEAGRERPGLDNLIRWLRAQRESDQGSTDEQQLRMESDEHLVQIVTIHKSKGLEYPIVFLPFIWSAKDPKKNVQAVVAYHDAKRQLVLDMCEQDQPPALEAARVEQLAEDLRLLYVALTRARSRCYFTWGMVGQAENSALAYLLHQFTDEQGEVKCGMNDLSDQQIFADLEKLGSSLNRQLLIQDLPDARIQFKPDHNELKVAEPLTFDYAIKQAWQLSSYSQLASTAAHVESGVGERPDHDQGVDSSMDAAVISQSRSRFTFPKGAQAGLFLHQIMESIDFTRPEVNLLAIIENGLDQYGFSQDWAKVIAEWIGDVLSASLDLGKVLQLSQINNSKRLVEMEFQFPLNRVSASAINQLLNKNRQSVSANAQKSALNFAELNGMLKGFIDLIFEHDGKFYVLDYKSNFLGYQPADYSQNALQQAIESHHYDLQFLLYTVALHRYLSHTLPHYDYSTHVGGVYYLFLRGMSAGDSERHGVYFAHPPFELIETLDKILTQQAVVSHA